MLIHCYNIRFLSGLHLLVCPLTWTYAEVSHLNCRLDYKVRLAVFNMWSRFEFTISRKSWLWVFCCSPQMMAFVSRHRHRPTSEWPYCIQCPCLSQGRVVSHPSWRRRNRLISEPSPCRWGLGLGCGRLQNCQSSSQYRIICWGDLASSACR